MKFFGRGVLGCVLLLTAVLFAGCATTKSKDAAFSDAQVVGAPPADPNPSQTLLHVGDEITVTFSDVVNTIPPFDDTIKEDGSITLNYDQKFHAAGKTAGALQDEIRERYVPTYFKYLTVTVKPQTRFYFVGGEVRGPGRQAYTGSMTVLGAIDTAGGFTDFSNKHKILVTRSGGKSFWVDGIKALSNSALNVPIYPDDRVDVKKRLW